MEVIWPSVVRRSGTVMRPRPKWDETSSISFAPPGPRGRRRGGVNDVVGRGYFSWKGKVGWCSHKGGWCWGKGTREGQIHDPPVWWCTATLNCTTTFPHQRAPSIPPVLRGLYLSFCCSLGNNQKLGIFHFCQLKIRSFSVNNWKLDFSVSPTEN